jgi:hypothetical protein
MESYEILRETFKKVSPKEVAAAMGLSLSLVYKWAQPGDGRGSGVDSPLDRVAELIKLSEDPQIMRWLCYKAGGYFVENTRDKESTHFDLVPTYTEIIQQFADLLQSITAAASDQSISSEESDKIRIQWDELKAYTEGFVRCCEEGDFEKLKKSTKS